MLDYKCRNLAGIWGDFSEKEDDASRGLLSSFSHFE